MSDNDGTPTKNGTTITDLEIEDDLLDRAQSVYPATSTRRELVRRVFERGVRARETEIGPTKTN